MVFRLPIPWELDKPREIKRINKVKDKNSILENRLVLMPRDPTTVFAYYDFSGKTLRELKKRGRNEAYIAIQSEDNMAEKQIFFDVNNERSMNYYFTGLKSGVRYHAGMYIPRIKLFIESNIVDTPINYESSDTSCRFMNDKGLVFKQNL
jgi:hypothetical protein